MDEIYKDEHCTVYFRNNRPQIQANMTGEDLGSAIIRHLAHVTACAGKALKDVTGLDKFAVINWQRDNHTVYECYALEKPKGFIQASSHQPVDMNKFEERFIEYVRTAPQTKASPSLES